MPTLTDEASAPLRSIEAIAADLAKEANMWARRIELAEFASLTQALRCDMRGLTMVLQQAADDLCAYLQERAEDRAMGRGPFGRIGRN
jgi:hypothetical protein